MRALPLLVEKMAAAKKKQLTTTSLTKVQAVRRTNRVLWSLTAVAVAFIVTIGAGLRVFSDRIQNDVAVAAAIRNAVLIADVLTAPESTSGDVMGLSDQSAGVSATQFDARWAELRRGVLREFRRVDGNGMIVDSSRAGEVGARIPESAMSVLRQGRRVDTQIDFIKGVELPVGVAMSYVPLIINKEFVAAVGVWADRTEDSRDTLRQVQITFAAFAVVFFGFCIPTGFVLRRFLLERFSVENELALKTNELILGEVVAQIGYWSISSRADAMILSGEAERLLGVVAGDTKTSLDNFAGLFRAADKAQILKGLQDVLTGAVQEFQIETTAVDRDGVTHDLRLVAQRRLQTDEASLFGVVIDITSEKTITRTLRDSEEKFRLLTDSASDVISFYDRNRKLTYVSPSVYRVTGYKQEEVIGHDTFAVVHPDDVRALLERRGLTGGQARPNIETAIWRLRRKDGSYIWMESNVSVVDFANSEFQVVSIARDINERIEREKALQEAQDKLKSNADDLRLLATELDMERQRAERADAAKSQFLATMSHELRTPMTGIIGMAELLLGSTRSPEQEKQLRLLTKSARILLDLLNEILDLSKIESGKFELEEIDFSLSDLLQDVHQLFGSVTSEKGVSFELISSGVNVDGLAGDPKRLRQALVNLVGNAIKFTTKGFVRVTTSQRVVDDRIEVSFAIADSGIGISAENIAKLFQPFTQADASTARRFGGTGLGLTISKHFAEAMDGNITVESERGRGSTFTLTVKLRKASNGFAPVVESKARVQGTQVRPLRILFAEDTDTTRYLVVSMLSRQGHTVIAVENGELAIKAAQDDVFDIALIDMHMPVLDGMDAVRTIRAMPMAISKIPIIALTADLIAENIAKYIKAGANIVVGKPIDWPILYGTMASLTMNGTPTTEQATKGALTHPVDTFNSVMLAEIEGMLGAEGLKKLLTKFSTNIGTYRDKLLAAHERRDRKGVTDAAHALRGVASQFGADHLSSLAQRIEERQGNPDELDAVKSDLIRAVDEAVVEADRRSAA